MSSEAVAITVLIIGVAIILVAFAFLIRMAQRSDRAYDDMPMGDLPKVPEFLHRRRDIE